MKKALILLGTSFLLIVGCSNNDGDKKTVKEEPTSTQPTSENTTKPEDAYNERFVEIEELIAAKNTTEAQEKLQAIITETKGKEALKTHYDKATAKLATLKKEATKVEKPTTEQPKKVEKPQVTKSQKKEYTSKLAKIETDLKKLDPLYAEGITSKMVEAENKKWAAWDKALNEIYGVLKTQLSTSEMNALQEKQRKWIKDRDAKVKELASQGGTIARLESNSALTELTRKRCYELVETYMK
jgi:uncharacterized protein YecT (DUF1311 family)